jgi:putative transposase
MGTPVAEVCRKLGMSEQTFYRWKRTFAGKGDAARRWLREVEAANRTRKPLVADLRLDKSMLPEIIRISGPASPILCGRIILRGLEGEITSLRAAYWP